MLVEKTIRLDRKKPLVIARKFRIPLETVHLLQAGGPVEVLDAVGRTMKQWGMVKYMPTILAQSQNEDGALHILEGETTVASIDCEGTEPISTENETRVSVHFDEMTESKSKKKKKGGK